MTTRTPIIMSTLTRTGCLRDAYLESSGESAKEWCTNLNAKITGSMDTDYSMRFKAVFGHFHDLRARPDLHHVYTMSCRSNHVYRLSSMFLGVLSQSSETMPPHARRSCVDQRQNCRIPLSVCEVGFNRNVCDGNNRVLKRL